jgi:hypothetical protein
MSPASSSSLTPPPDRSASAPSTNVRAFGREPSDLDVRFDTADRPSLVTALLSRCTDACRIASTDHELFWWNQTLSARIAALLRIACATAETSSLRAPLRCTAAACQQPFEIELPLAALLESAPTTPGELLPFTLPQGHPLTLRRPTGHDQVAWRTLRPRSRTEALQTIVRSLVVDGDWPLDADTTAFASTLESLANAMEDFDPLVSFRVHTACPHCNSIIDTPVDLEALAIDQLHRTQRALLREVHQLATRYGWSEADTLAVPAWRRAHYLRLIADAEDSA